MRCKWNALVFIKSCWCLWASSIDSMEPLRSPGWWPCCHLYHLVLMLTLVSDTQYSGGGEPSEPNLQWYIILHPTLMNTATPNWRGWGSWPLLDNYSPTVMEQEKEFGGQLHINSKVCKYLFGVNVSWIIILLGLLFLDKLYWLTSIFSLVFL